MFVHRIDWKVLADPEQRAAREFVEEVGRFLEPQPGCIGVAAWGYGDDLHSLSAWETGAQAEAAARLIAEFMEEQGERWRPIMTGEPAMEVIGHPGWSAEPLDQDAPREVVRIG